MRRRYGHVDKTNCALDRGGAACASGRVHDRSVDEAGLFSQSIGFIPNIVYTILGINPMDCES